MRITKKTLGVLFYFAGGFVACLIVFILNKVIFPVEYIYFFAAASILLSWTFIGIISFSLYKILNLKNNKKSRHE